MSRRILSWAALATGVLLLGATTTPPVKGARSSQCIAADTTSTFLISTIRELITGGKSASRDSLRNRLGLSGIDTTSVTLVTSSHTCASAASAVDQLANVSSSGRLVYVIQAGKQRFVVADPNDHTGEYHRSFVFDSHFSLVGALGY